LFLGPGDSRVAISEEIIVARNCGFVRCGLSEMTAPTVTQLACEFGLRDDVRIYKEIDASKAELLIRKILHKDMAYRSEIMPAEQSAKLADRFVRQFGSHARYFTNGTFYEEYKQVSSTVSTGPSWDPATEATFDTGVLAIGPEVSGCLWIEDED
jgi:hypothetical protein